MSSRQVNMLCVCVMYVIFFVKQNRGMCLIYTFALWVSVLWQNVNMCFAFLLRGCRYLYTLYACVLWIVFAFWEQHLRLVFAICVCVMLNMFCVHDIYFTYTLWVFGLCIGSVLWLYDFVLRVGFVCRICVGVMWIVYAICAHNMWCVFRARNMFYVFAFCILCSRYVVRVMFLCSSSVFCEIDVRNKYPSGDLRNFFVHIFYRASW